MIDSEFIPYLLLGPFAIWVENGYDGGSFVQAIIAAWISLVPTLVGFIRYTYKSRNDFFTVASYIISLGMWMFMGLAVWSLRVT